MYQTFSANFWRLRDFSPLELAVYHSASANKDEESSGSGVKCFTRDGEIVGLRLTGGTALSLS